MKTLLLDSDYKEAAAGLKGQHPAPSHADQTIDQDTVVIAPDGSVPAVLLSKKIEPALYEPAYEIWKQVDENLNGEFLVDEDLLLEECEKVGFVKHHPTMCRRLGTFCKDLNKRDHVAGAELIARLVSHTELDPETLFLEDSRRRRVHEEAAEALEYLRKSLRVAKDSNGKISHRRTAAPYLITAILDRFGRNKGSGKLRDLFSNTDELRIALEKRLMRAFDLTSPEALWGEPD
jgi:hypothetical protein